MHLKRDSGQPDQSGPKRQRHKSPGREEWDQQHDQASGTTSMTGGKGVAVKPRVETRPFSRRALAAEEPLEGGGDRAGDQCSEQHAPSKVVPGRITPGECRCRAEQPERTVAAVSDSERQQAQEARLTRDDEARR